MSQVLGYPGEQIESLIKAGAIEAARVELKNLPVTKISPIDLSLHCSFLRRVGLVTEALNLLRPLVYPKSRSAQTASAVEIIEYAANLVRQQITGEAEVLLKGLDAKKHPVALLRLAFLKIANWDFATSNEYLKQFMSLTDESSYDHLVARLNYLQGLVYLEKIDESLSYANDLIPDLMARDAKFLLSAAFEFKSEVLRQRGDYVGAELEIQQAMSLNLANESTDYFLLKRQRLVNQLFESGWSKYVQREFAAVMSEALARKHFESQRELIFRKALVTRDKKALNGLYWGTRSLHFKARVLREAEQLGMNLDCNTHVYFDQIGDSKNSKAKIWQLKQAELKSSARTTKLLYCLLDENIKPQFISDLFNAVYIDERYIPEYSRDKIYQLIFHLRLLLQKKKWPLKLKFTKQRGFHFEFLTPVKVIKPSLVRSKSAQSLYSASMKKKLSLSFNDLLAVYNCSPRTLNRKIKKMIADGELSKVGCTNKVRYVLAPNHNKA